MQRSRKNLHGRDFEAGEINFQNFSVSPLRIFEIVRDCSIRPFEATLDGWAPLTASGQGCLVTPNISVLESIFYRLRGDGPARSGHSLQEPVVYGNKVKMNPDRDAPGEPSQVHIDSRLR